MKYLDVRLRQPDWMLHPMQTFVRETDVVRYEELLAWSLRPTEGVEYELFYAEVTDVERYRAAVADVDSLLEYRIVPVDEGSLHVWARQETRPEDGALREAFAERRLLVVPPVRFDAEAAMRFTIVGAGDDIQDTLADVPAEIDVTINEIGPFDRRVGTPVGRLTDRQREAVATALHLGYYDVPREAALADVAAAIGCAESTASVLLRRAGRNVFASVLGTDRDDDRISASPGTSRRPPEPTDDQVPR